jgi:hypothetical protein
LELAGDHQRRHLPGHVVNRDVDEPRHFTPNPVAIRAQTSPALVPTSILTEKSEAHRPPLRKKTHGKRTTLIEGPGGGFDYPCTVDRRQGVEEVVAKARGPFCHGKSRQTYAS